MGILISHQATGDRRLRVARSLRIALGTMVFGLAGLSPVWAQDFDALWESSKTAPASKSEAEILKLLQVGNAEGRPTQALWAGQQWLRQNLPQDVLILYQAGHAAELSGDIKGAVALYQQFLMKADPDASETSDAILALHVLMIERLNDANGAYAYSRLHGARLAGNAAMRQWDRWFLNTAVSRGDKKGIADRLKAISGSGISADVLRVHYVPYYNKLLRNVATLIEQPNNNYREDDYQAVKDLAASIKFDDELKLLLDWEASVRWYNIQKGKEEEVQAPLAEAKALLAKFPKYAARVQDGWGGGGRSYHYRGNPAVYMLHEREAKAKVLLDVYPKLDLEQRIALLNRWTPNYYAGNRFNNFAMLEQGELDAIRSMDSTAITHKLSQHYGIKDWTHYKKEDVQGKGSRFAGIGRIEAAMLSAYAASPESFDKAMQIAFSKEAWRMDPSKSMDGRYADRLWHMMGRPGGNEMRDKWKNKEKELAKKIESAKLDPKTPANQRVNTVKQLLADYKSSSPKTPGIRWRLTQALKVTYEAVPELVKDGSVEAKSVLREVLPQGFDTKDGPLSGEPHVRGVSAGRYHPRIIRNFERHRGNRKYVEERTPQAYKAYPIEPGLRQALQAQAQKGAIEDWLVIAWVNSQFIERTEDVQAVAKQVATSPAFNKLGPEARYAVRDWFKAAVLNPGETAVVQQSDPKNICKDILALTNESTGEQIAAAIKSAIEGLKKSPIRVNTVGIDKLGSREMKGATEAVVADAFLPIIYPLRYTEVGRDLPAIVRGHYLKSDDPVTLHRVANYYWKHTASHHPHRKEILYELAQNMVDKHPSVASVYASGGLLAIEQHHRGHTWFDRKKDIPMLKSVRGRAATAMGLMVIPVPKSDPRYAVYKSQADWLVGNEDTAWTAIDENWEQLMPVHRELSMPYLMWVLDMTIYGREETRQEEVVTALRSWANEEGTSVSIPERIQLELTYGEIAIQRGMLKHAHQIYERAAKNKAFEASPARYQAFLGKAKVERLAKNFDGALNTLDTLAMERIPELWAPVKYARSEVLFDMEEFDDAAEVIDSVLAYDPNHADGKIMQGKLQLKLNKIMDATVLDIGSAKAQKQLVPGESLKVTLVDPTLAVSGAGVDIEVVVWTTTGDREEFFLRQFGDQKTKYRGEIETALGAPNSGDRILQVIGDDEVFYAYSERFLKKMPGVDAKQGGPITVVSDAVLIASARRLLTVEEQRTRDVEKGMRELTRSREKEIDLKDAKGRIMYGARIAREAADRAIKGEEPKEQQVDVQTLVKPGQPIHIRVVDPDRSRTAQKDSLAISIHASSGDSINRIVLEETDTHSGWFEGKVKTGGAQATASGTAPEPGRNPNMVISPKTTYPAWKPIVEKNRKPHFVIDLNDNVELGEMTIRAEEEGSALSKFIIQTGMNHKDLATIGGTPVNQVTPEKPWHPSLIAMSDADSHHHNGRKSIYEEFSSIRYHLENGWINQQHSHGLVRNVAGPSEALPADIPKAVDWKRHKRHGNVHGIVRFRAYFYEPASVTRKFSLKLGKHQLPPKTHPSVAKPAAQFLLTVNGRVISDRESKELAGSINLRPGVHYVELWATGWMQSTVGFGRETQLMANLAGGETMEPCPDSFFDPEKFPEGSLPQKNGRAEITKSEDGKSFKVKFAPGSRARIVKLMLMDYQGSAPAINRISLKDPSGGQVLPVPYDFAELNSNDVLELLSKDKVSVRYLDDRYVSEKKKQQERFLNVSFYNGNIGFRDRERYQWGGEMRSRFEDRIRFEYGKPLDLWIIDPDMDVTPNPDKINLVVASKTGGKRKVVATETEPSSGEFLVQITPIPGEPSSANQIKVAKGGTLVAAYKDMENTNPGVPFNRYDRLQHADYKTPQVVISSAKVEPLDLSAFEPERRPRDQWFRPGFQNLSIEEFAELSVSAKKAYAAAQGRLMPRWNVNYTLENGSTVPENIHGGTITVNVIAPHLILKSSSILKVYVQAESARRLVGAKGAFNVDVPGTLEFDAGLTQGRGLPSLIPVYYSRSNPEEGTTISDRDRAAGTAVPTRFRLRVPVKLGIHPPNGVLSEEEKENLSYRQPDALVASYNDTVHIGFQYKDEAGQTQWMTASTKLITHPTLDVMEPDYRLQKDHAYVGEELYMRVVDLGADKTDNPDVVNVLMQAQSGGKHYVQLRETDPHSGVFQGALMLNHVESVKQPEGTNATPLNVMVSGFPVQYGDTIATRYKDSNGVASDVYKVLVKKGADGVIRPFSKVYDDPETAMRVQFSLAESYLELAKRHRMFGEGEVAEHEYERARQLLAKAMDEFRDPVTRAQAEYLLGNLTLEEANDTDDADTAELRYRAALSRFMNVTGKYPDTVAASKAQFKIATVYEKLKEPEIAAQEYVKLAYKYPDSEFLATAMARLGTHFLKKAQGYERKAEPLLADEENKDAIYEGTALTRLSKLEYVKAADIFGRLQRRFPDHSLAGKAGLRAGQAYMRADMMPEAIKAFNSVVNNESYDGKTLRSQAMYWVGMCYENVRQAMAAYSVYKRLTYDFPESKWASYARAQLSQEHLLNLEIGLEEQRVEEGRL